MWLAPSLPWEGGGEEETQDIYRKHWRALHILSLWMKRLGGWGREGFHNETQKRKWTGRIFHYSIICTSLFPLVFIFCQMCMCMHLNIEEVFLWFWSNLQDLMAPGSWFQLRKAWYPPWWPPSTHSLSNVPVFFSGITLFKKQTWSKVIHFLHNTKEMWR